MGAVVALFTESVHGKGAVTDTSLTIPLLMRNKVPDGFETDDRLDVTLRPDEVCLTFNIVLQAEQCWGLVVFNSLVLCGGRNQFL